MYFECRDAEIPAIFTFAYVMHLPRNIKLRIAMLYAYSTPMKSFGVSSLLKGIALNSSIKKKTQRN